MNRISIIMLTIIVLFFGVGMIHAQKITQWIGGTPGRENDWFCSKNWTSQAVPNEFSTVVINDQFTGTPIYPKIKCGIAKVWNLEMDPSAQLFIEINGQLWVMNAIQLRNKKSIHSKGTLLLLNLTYYARNSISNNLNDVFSQFGIQ